jgi:hypothetical protein
LDSDIEQFFLSLYFSAPFLDMKDMTDGQITMILDELSWNWCEQALSGFSQIQQTGSALFVTAHASHSSPTFRFIG